MQVKDLVLTYETVFINQNLLKEPEMLPYKSPEGKFDLAIKKLKSTQGEKTSFNFEIRVASGRGQKMT